MPLGAEIEERGLLLRDNGALVLQTDEGGFWRLDAPVRARKLVGCRIRVRGRRAGFDLLDVSAMGMASEDQGWTIKVQPCALPVEVCCYALLPLLLALVAVINAA